jgi:Bacterial Ig-like domain (group 3)/Beta-propeller repeat
MRARINSLRLSLEILEQRLAPASASLLQAYGQLPISFEANAGETASQVQYLAHGSGYALFLTSTSAVLSLENSGTNAANASKPPTTVMRSAPTTVTGLALRMNLVGGNPNAAVLGLDKLPGTSNYFIGNDPSQWHTGIANYTKVEYQNAYAGVNLIYYGNQQQLEYDFVVAPGADPGSIRFAVQGADSLSIDDKGNLILHTAIGDVLEHAPVIYQDIGGVRQAVAGQFVLLGNKEVGFQIGAYDASFPLTIDPVLSYSTYLGGSTNDSGQSIAVDGSGNAYITGSTESTNFPTTTGAFQTSHASDSGHDDAFITKMNASGTALVYSTYLGGNGSDYGVGIAVDNSGNAYVTGPTQSTNFPTTSGTFQTSYGGGSYDTFVSKLNASGTGLVYSTYLGGNNYDYGYGVAVDGSGNAYITGNTVSTNFPTTAGAFQTSFGGGSFDFFVTKLNASGTSLAYSTYLGSDNTSSSIHSIAVDGSGNAYVTGYTTSTNFPTTSGAFQTTLHGGTNAFVTKLNTGGTGLVYSTYLGGNTTDVGESIAVDGSGNAYVTGYTTSTNFPTTSGAFQTSYGEDYDAFVTKLNASGSGLVFSTYLGGISLDVGESIAVDGSGNTYVTGATYSTDFPTTADPLQASFGGGSYDAFITKMNASGTALVYSTYLGGNGYDGGAGIAVDESGNAYVTGDTGSTNFPTTAGAFQTSFSSGYRCAFVAKLALPSSTTTTLTDNGPNPSTYGQAVSFAVTVSGGTTINGETVYIEDASNANAVVASPTLSGNTVTFTISDLSIGTHNLFAVYNGDDNNAASNSSATPVTQVINEPAPAVASVVVNGGAPAYTDSFGNSFSLAGQNSVVEQILVTFNEAVTLDAGAFTITNNHAGVTVVSGPDPNTLAVNAIQTPVYGSGNTQWIVTFYGPGTTPIPYGAGNVIKDGLYILNTIGSKVHASGLTATTTHSGFWALYGDTTYHHISGVDFNIGAGYVGDGYSDASIGSGDFAAFKACYNSDSTNDYAPPSYNVEFDANLDGSDASSDFVQFKNNYNADWEF